jgi:putative GTP pyrophosphokinase
MAMQSNVEGLLREYEQSKELYDDFKDHLVKQIAELLHASSVKCHEINGRLKTRSSFAGKIANGKRVYASLSEVTDIAGIRVTTYFARDVDLVAEILSPVFTVDPVNSIDKRITIDPDRFGYVSLHYVVSDREANSRFAGLKAEVQIRSILQHAWAAIEHDLGYKSAQAVPRVVRRRFAMVAGLLELADSQFDALRDDIRAYVDRQSKQVDAQDTEIDLHTLELFVARDELVGELDQQIAQVVNVDVRGKVPLRRLLVLLNLVGLTHIRPLKVLLETQRDEILRFASEWFETEATGHTVALASGTSLMFLFYLHVAADSDKSRAITLLSKSGISERLLETTAARIDSIRKNM